MIIIEKVFINSRKTAQFLVDMWIQYDKIRIRLVRP